MSEHDASAASFDKGYWDRRWGSGEHGPPSMSAARPNPHLVRELAGLVPGTALDAGCGAGNEALWLASVGWQVVGVDISAAALEQARAKARTGEAGERIEWVEADLGSWTPPRSFDLVTTHYAHANIPQLDLYRRIAEWVAPDGTLLVVGHGPASAGAHGHQNQHHHGDEHHRHTSPPADATATAEDIVALLDPALWRIVAATEARRAVTAHGEQEDALLADVVVHAQRR